VLIFKNKTRDVPQFIQFNASESYVAECSTGAGCPPSVDPADCYGVCGNLDCYNLDKGDIPVVYDLYFSWNFSDVTSEFGRAGYWYDDYDWIVEFGRLYLGPIEHWARLRMDYIPV